MTRLRQDCAVGPTRRVDAIDFWRGLVLCTIFINHIPGNIFENLTQKNFGFSDSAEAFVYLSGMSLALAYGPRFVRGRAGEVVGSLARRAVKLYGVHIGLSLAAIAIFAIGAFATDDGALLEVHGRDLFVDDPKAALIGLLSLGHQLGYFNILPLYILLLALVPPLLWIGCRSPALMLVVSFAAYAASRYFGWSMPTWPMKGTWFFDPFAWQFLMAIGLWAGLTLRNERLPDNLILILLAAAIVVLGMVSVTDAFSFYPGLQDWTRGWADLDKGVLGLGRLLHFVAFAYLLHALRLSNVVGKTFAFQTLSRLGRHSLWIFALLSILAAVGQVLTAALGHSLLIDALTIGGGVALLCSAASLLEARRRPELMAQATV